MKKNYRFIPLLPIILMLVLPAFIPLSAQTAIGGNTPDQSAMLDVQSTAKGVLFPRLTTAQRNLITSAATGLMIFNTSTRCLEINLGTTSPSWQNIKCTTCGAFVSVGVWKEFLCYNLGANPNIDPFTPSWELNGDYYQWGRNTVAAVGPSDNVTPNAGAPASWNSTSPGNSDWLDSSKTANDPCPSGFRVPTKDQWNGVKDNSLNPQSNVGSWVFGINNYGSGKFFGPGLFLPAAGLRSFTNGILSSRGDKGQYWSSTESGTGDGFSWYFNIGSGSVNFLKIDNRSGLSLRCVAQ